MSGSALYSGRVMHLRLAPRRHRLQYRLFSLLLDLDELPALHRRLKLLSVDRPNLFSFRQADHGDGSGAGLQQQVQGWLQAAGLAGGGRVRLLAMPRILGYAFNPLSVYFCDAPQGGLQAIVYEVNSTFGERHHYVLPLSGAQAEQAAAGQRIAQRCAKRMHVSPFIGMDAHYQFDVLPPADAEGSGLHLGVDVHEDRALVLLTAFGARRQALDDVALARALLLHPLLTLKVVAAIHWEALRLWWRRVPWHPHPGPAPEARTVEPPPSAP